MYQVLLVDDEPWVLLGLINSIEWGELGLEVSAQTTNSSEALNIILNKQPDIVITDIQMPNVSGIDLMRCAREQNIDCDFIVFSGYSDFEYAKRAIEYGVFAYLLKPLNQKELRKTLSLLVENIKAKKYIMREQTEGIFLDGTIEIDVKTFHNNDNPFCFLTGYITFSDKILLDKHLSEISHSNYKLGSNKYVYLINAEKAIVRSALESFLKSEFCIEKEYLSFGISDCFYNENNIKSTLQESNIAAHNHFLFPDRYINEFTATDIACCNLFLENVYDALDRGDRDLSELLIAERLELYCIEHNLNMQDFSYIYNAILGYIEKISHHKGEMEYEVLSYDRISLKYANVCEAARFLNLLVQDVGLDQLSSESNTSLYASFEQMLDYIDENYNQEISLSDLSAKFYINMTYICDLFKKNRSTTFSKYLTNLRLEKAYHMICYTKTPLSEITEVVGYRDYYYFIKKFKKKYNITPGQLRKAKTANNTAEK